MRPGGARPRPGRRGWWPAPGCAGRRRDGRRGASRRCWPSRARPRARAPGSRRCEPLRRPSAGRPRRWDRAWPWCPSCPTAQPADSRGGDSRDEHGSEHDRRGARRRFARVPSGSRRRDRGAGARRTRGDGRVRGRSAAPDGPRGRPAACRGLATAARPAVVAVADERVDHMPSSTGRPPRGAGSVPIGMRRPWAARSVPVPGPPPASARPPTSAAPPGSPRGPSSARCPAAWAGRAGPR